MTKLFNNPDLIYMYDNDEENMIATSFIKNDKDLLILALYLNHSGISQAKRTQRLIFFETSLNDMKMNIEKNTNFHVEFMIIPIIEGNTRFECTYSSKNANKIIDDIKEEYKL